MFKFLKVMPLVLLFLVIGLISRVEAESFLYSNTISTYAVTDATITSNIDIDYASCKVQSIGIWHITTDTETYVVYELADDTNTVTEVAKILVPGVVGWYPIWGDDVLNGSALTGSDLISIPKLYIRHDNDEVLTATYCVNDTVQIIYKR